MAPSITEWVALSEADLGEVGQLADGLHPGLHERADVFAEKIRLFPPGCRKLRRGAQLVGYGIAHPWRIYDIPALDHFLGKLPEAPDCLYVHDVAIDPSARGHGAAGTFIDHLVALAAKLSIAKLACVSVYGTDAMWARYGFHPAIDEAPGDEIVAKLATYGDSAKYMVADVSLRSKVSCVGVVGHDNQP